MTFDEWTKTVCFQKPTPEAYDLAKDAWKEAERQLEVKIDRLLNHCSDPECMECAVIICPHGEPLHFHHDGCPACTQMEQNGELS